MRPAYSLQTGTVYLHHYRKRLALSRFSESKAGRFAYRSCMQPRKRRSVQFGEYKMEYINLGKAGLKVSRICLGCMSYGSRKWRDWVLDEPESIPFFRQALDAGINFFDTADMYSAGASEEVTG